MNNEPINIAEVNQGKRLIKRLHKVNVRPGQEVDFLLGAMRSCAMGLIIEKARAAGASAEDATGFAVAANDAITVPEPTGHTGLDLYRLLMFNGAAPGRVKAALDCVLAATFGWAKFDQALFSMHSTLGKIEQVAMPESDVEFPTHPGFPSNDPIRENY